MFALNIASRCCYFCRRVFISSMLAQIRAVGPPCKSMVLLGHAPLVKQPEACRHDKVSCDLLGTLHAWLPWCRSAPRGCCQLAMAAIWSVSATSWLFDGSGVDSGKKSIMCSPCQRPLFCSFTWSDDASVVWIGTLQIYFCFLFGEAGSSMFPVRWRCLLGLRRVSSVSTEHSGSAEYAIPGTPCLWKETRGSMKKQPRSLTLKREVDC